MGNWFGGWDFFPVLSCGGVAMEILLIFPVPDGYLILHIAHKPLKQNNKAKSTVVWCGHVQRALICVVSLAEEGFLFEACSWISTPLTFLSGELWE